MTCCKIQSICHRNPANCCFPDPDKENLRAQGTEINHLPVNTHNSVSVSLLRLVRRKLS